jgi:glycosyltransferase involved in cell wall biosynthesis
VIPAYNAPDLLERAVRSVLGQSVSDLEIVVVDDGSIEAQDHVTGLDRRVRFVRQENRGVSVARNLGASLAESELLAFLDQDDVWHPRKLAAQLDAVETHPDAAFWCTAFDWVSSDTTVASDPDQPTYRGLLSTQSVLLSSLLVRAEDYWQVGGHSPLLAQMQDWDLFLRLSMSGRVPHMVAERLVDYHLHGANASADYRTAAAERLDILNLHERRARARDDRATLEAIARGRARTHELFAYQAVDAARTALATRDIRALASHLAFAGRHDPRVALRATGKALAARTIARNRA